jgi:hypothetical protein
VTVIFKHKRRREREAAKRLRRWDVINLLLAGRKQPTSFLEIGVFEGECGAQIAADRKVGVDPILRDAAKGMGRYSTLCETTSDDFFAGNAERFDVVFIDAYQATPGLTGDVWQAVVALRRLSSLDTYTIAIETGVTVVQRRENTCPLKRAVEDYPALEAHRAEALRLIDPRTWLSIR